MGTRAVHVCRECHHAIHDAVPKEKELGRHWNTKELLLSHPIIANHVQWMRKKYKTNVASEQMDRLESASITNQINLNYG
jgi:hypothetical protein